MLDFSRRQAYSTNRYPSLRRRTSLTFLSDNLEAYNEIESHLESVLEDVKVHKEPEIALEQTEMAAAVMLTLKSKIAAARVAADLKELNENMSLFLEECDSSNESDQVQMTDFKPN